MSRTLNLLVPDVKKIAILRSGALGDFIVILPSIQAIRNAYPRAELILLGKPWLNEFIKNGRCLVDRFIEVPVMRGIREEEGKDQDELEIKKFIERMREEHFDIVLQFQGQGVAANKLIKQFGAGLTVGMTSSLSEKLDRSISFFYYQSEILRYQEVAALIGAMTCEIEPRIPVLNDDLEEAEKYIRINRIAPYVVLHPFAMDVRRSWPLEKFGKLGEEIYNMGWQIVFSGSRSDKNPIDDLMETMKTPSINSCGMLSLGGLSGLLSKSTLVIASDTGPLHLARAVGAKTVGIYWAPNLINWGPLSRNNHRPVISWKMECPVCGVIPNDPYPFEPSAETCNHNLSFVKEVEIQGVLEAALQLLPPVAK